MDEVTVKVMSCSCKMADITDEGISRTYSIFSLRFVKHYSSLSLIHKVLLENVSSGM